MELTLLAFDGLKTEAPATPEELTRLAARRWRLGAARLRAPEILLRSIDARGGRVRYVHRLAAEVGLDEGQLRRLLQQPGVSLYERPVYELPKKLNRKPPAPPLVVGSGPAGLFAALALSRAGAGPVVLERGSPLEVRAAAVGRFWSAGRLEAECNVQFGEGGAGTFSDGKLTSRTKSPAGRFVLETLVRAGAPADILYEAHPHVGTDLLRGVVRRLREEIEAGGGRFVFDSSVSGFLISGGRVVGVRTSGGEEIEACAVILAAGGGARDVYRMLHELGAVLEAKPFAVGFRIEHPQELVDEARYGPGVRPSRPDLPPADYRLTYRDAATGRGVYTFCMCPGGEIIAASSEPGGLVVNGMSRRSRSGPFANAAVVSTVGPPDFSSGPLGGIEFQQRLEEAAYALGGGGYRAPAQRAADFIAGEISADLPGSSYRLGLESAALQTLLPDELVEALRRGLKNFGRQMRGFDSREALLTGVESRTSAPVRIVRGSDGASPTLPGLYPAGEGAGYAGGIVSSAADGLKAAAAVLTALV